MLKEIERIRNQVAQGELEMAFDNLNRFTQITGQHHDKIISLQSDFGQNEKNRFGTLIRKKSPT